MAINHPNRLDAASARIAMAKAGFTTAAQAALNGDPDAERMAKTALAELGAARAELQQLHGAPPGIGVCALLHVKRS